MSSPTPIRLTPADALRYIDIRRRMLEDAPWAFAASPEDDRGLDPEHLARSLALESFAIYAVVAGAALRSARAEEWRRGSPIDGGVRPGGDVTAGLGEHPHRGMPADEIPDTTPHPADDLRSDQLVAVAGIRRRTQPKFAHRAGISGVFVDPRYRGLGLGRVVVAAAVEHARGWPGVDWVDLGVSENSPEAQRLYESLGFRAWGREPESLQYGGRRYDEIWMTLRL